MSGILLGNGEWAIGPAKAIFEGEKWCGALSFQHLKTPQECGTEVAETEDQFDGEPFYIGFLNTTDIDRMIGRLERLKEMVEKEREAEK